MTVEIEENQPFISIAKSASGYYYAAYMVWSAISGSYCVSRAGTSRSKKKFKAINEGEAWARRERVDFRQ